MTSSSALWLLIDVWFPNWVYVSLLVHRYWFDFRLGHVSQPERNALIMGTCNYFVYTYVWRSYWGMCGVSIGVFVAFLIGKSLPN